MSKSKIEIGNEGEEKAKHFLIQNGYEIIVQNYRYKRGEVDLIAIKNDVLCFVEVKTRKNTSFGYPESFITNKKEELLRDLAEHYIFKIDWQKDIRFDAVSIITASNEIVLFEDIF